MVRFPSVELVESQQLLSALFDNSKVGLAVFDEDCCYRLVNPYLARLNGTSIEGNLGKHVRNILGKLGVSVEGAIREVFATAKPLLNCQFEGALPTKAHGWRVYNLFPVMDVNGRVAQVAAVVVELGTDVAVERIAAHSLTSTVLRSWKDIARYAGTCVKTVQRWERTYNFPVRRVNRNKGSVVFAFQNEVDDWLRTRTANADKIRYR